MNARAWCLLHIPLCANGPMLSVLYKGTVKHMHLLAPCCGKTMAQLSVKAWQLTILRKRFSTFWTDPHRQQCILPVEKIV
uniref:Secreted protein n=1 Tax=Rhipicephalus appendiculatus TaxID=34631 RepID=A0A131YC79_RHIAP